MPRGLITVVASSSLVEKNRVFARVLMENCVGKEGLAGER